MNSELWDYVDIYNDNKLHAVIREFRHIKYDQKSIECFYTHLKKPTIICPMDMNLLLDLWFGDQQ
ncbi:hypothetical protein D3C81_1654790 [compost metagenome]